MSCFIFDLSLYATLSSNGRLFNASAFEFRILLFAVQLVKFGQKSAESRITSILGERNALSSILKKQLHSPIFNSCSSTSGKVLPKYRVSTDCKHFLQVFKFF